MTRPPLDTDLVTADEQVSEYADQPGRVSAGAIGVSGSEGGGTRTHDLGIKSQTPSPATKLSPSERRRKKPRDSARFRRASVTSVVTVRSPSELADSHDEPRPHAMARSGFHRDPRHVSAPPGRPLGDVITGVGTSSAVGLREAAHKPAGHVRTHDGSSPLGKPTEKLSRAAQSRSDRRDARFELRDVLQNVTMIPRICFCAVRRIDGRQSPEIRRQEENGIPIAHFAHVMLCGLVWVCPVCGPKIRQQRATDLDAACATWIERHRVGSVMLLTLTAPHDFGQPLVDLLTTIREAFTSLVAGRAWQDDKRDFRLAHWVRAHDVTVGANGWHPHLHIVLFARASLTAAQLVELEERLFSRWVRAVTNRGHRPPSRRYGIQLEQARSREDTARYVCQVVTGDNDHPFPVALEVARSDLKTASHAGQRTPWQVLADFAETGDCADLALWHEWEKATERVQAIRWSSGLRAEVEIGEEQTDEEVVEAIVGGEVIYTFTMTEWRALCRTRGARAKALRVAEEGGEVAVQRLMAELVASFRCPDLQPIGAAD